MKTQQLIKTFALPILLSASLLSGTAYAGGGHDGKGGPDHYMKRVLDKLDLTDAQEDKIDSIMKADFDEMKDQFKEFKAIDEQLSTLTQAATLDNTAVDTLLDQKLVIIKDRMEKSIVAKHQVWQVLTADQQTEAKALIEKYREKMEKRRKDKHDD